MLPIKDAPIGKPVRMYLKKCRAWHVGHFAVYNGRPKPIISYMVMPGRVLGWEPALEDHRREDG